MFQVLNSINIFTESVLQKFLRFSLLRQGFSLHSTSKRNFFAHTGWIFMAWKYNRRETNNLSQWRNTFKTRRKVQRHQASNCHWHRQQRSTLGVGRRRRFLFGEACDLGFALLQQWGKKLKILLYNNHLQIFCRFISKPLVGCKEKSSRKWLLIQLLRKTETLELLSPLRTKISYWCTQWTKENWESWSLQTLKSKAQQKDRHLRKWLVFLQFKKLELNSKISGIFSKTWHDVYCRYNHWKSVFSQPHTNSFSQLFNHWNKEAFNSFSVNFSWHLAWTTKRFETKLKGKHVLHNSKIFNSGELEENLLINVP